MGYKLQVAPNTEALLQFQECYETAELPGCPSIQSRRTCSARSTACCTLAMSSTRVSACTTCRHNRARGGQQWSMHSTSERGQQVAQQALARRVRLVFVSPLRHQQAPASPPPTSPSALTALARVVEAWVAGLRHSSSHCSMEPRARPRPDCGRGRRGGRAGGVEGKMGEEAQAIRGRH